MTKKFQFWTGMALLICGCVLIASHFTLWYLPSAAIEVPDWQSIPRSPSGTIASDARHTGTLWFDGKKWRVIGGTCSDIFDLRLQVTPENPFIEGRIEPLVTTGSKDMANLVFIVTHANGDIQVGAEVWGREMKVGTLFKTGSPVFNLDLTIDRVNNRIRATVDGAYGTVFESRIKPWPFDRIPWFVGYNPYGGSYVVERFAGTIEVVQSKPAVGQGGRPAGTVFLRVAFAPRGLGRAQPLLSSGTTGKADFFYVVVDDPTHLHFGFDHWGTGGPKSSSIEFDPRSPHDIVVRSGNLGALRGDSRAIDPSYDVTLDGRDVLSGRVPFFPADAGQIFVGSNPIGGSSSEREFIGEILEKGATF